MQNKVPTILASSSPRRKKILTEEGLLFTIVVPYVEEVVLESARETVIENARRKAEQVHKTNKNSLVIGSDTVVAFNDKILGKPANLQEAKEMLLTLSGRKHEVFTAVSIRTETEKLDFYDTSHVYFKALRPEDIEQYFRFCNPLDKAGAYNIDEHGEIIIAKIEGSYTNIMGLPIEKLRENLKKIIF